MQTIILDAAEMTLRAETHAYLKEKLMLPEYYGANLDALYDCLTDMGPTEILFIHQDQSGEYFELTRRVFMAAARYNENLKLQFETSENE